MLRLLHGLFAALFLLGAVVQYNDPDPLRWIAIYLAAATSCGLVAARRVPRWLPATVGVVALAWAAGLASHVLGKVEPSELVGAWEMKDANVEMGREMYGLVIIAAWMIVILLTGQRRRQSGPVLDYEAARRTDRARRR
jgi:hypothetical protein